jgi:hypothetical protein
VLDALERVRARIGAHSTVLTSKDQTIQKPESAIALFNKDGNVMWEAP